MDRYPPIAEHGLIGDLQTAALVASDGTVDWWCCPRLDSPSVFASLLDHDKGGRFRIAPEGDDYVVRQPYFPRARSGRPAAGAAVLGHRCRLSGTALVGGVLGPAALGGGGRWRDGSGVGAATGSRR
jgi:Trehalase-like, N-terminal